MHRFRFIIVTPTLVIRGCRGGWHSIFGLPRSQAIFECRVHRLSRHKAEADSLDELADEVATLSSAIIRTLSVPFAVPFVVLSVVLSGVLSVVPLVHKAEAGSPDELADEIRPITNP